MASAFGLTILLPLTLELVRWAIAQSTATTATRNTIQESQASLVVDTDDAPDSFIVTTTTMTVAMLDDGPEGLCKCVRPQDCLRRSKMSLQTQTSTRQDVWQ